MKTVIATESRVLVSLSSDEILALANSMNEVLHNSSIDEHDCHRRIGINYHDLQEIHRSLFDIMRSAKSAEPEVFDAWRDGESMQIRAISVYGDPADLGLDEVSDKIRALLEEPEAYQAAPSNP
jgi:hypothetical protein